MARKRHFLLPLLARDTGGLHLVATGRPAPLATHLEPAFSSATRKRGLLGRDQLPAGTALVIAPCNAVHTFFMRFAIDIIFADREGRVLKIRPAVPARRVAGAWGGFATIEMAAGSAAHAGIVVGDRLEVRDVTVPAPPGEPRATA